MDPLKSPYAYKIRHQLSDCEVQTYCHDFTFIPQNSLNEILTQDTLRAILSEAPFKKWFYKREELVQLLAQGGKRMFAILLLIGREHDILKFHERDKMQSLDAQLPLTIEGVEEVLGSEGVVDVNVATDFVRVQWKLLTPVLRKDRSHRVFDEKTVLPFVENILLTKDGFEEISRVKLLASHQQLLNPDVNGNAIVIRKVNPSSHDSEEEERILYSLRVLKHPHIIKVLASFEHGSMHNFLFPVTDGNLQQLIDGELPREQHFKEDHSIIRELHGLATAINAVHTFSVDKYNVTMVGCHNDLKPKNILIKEKRFLLTGFGLSRLELPSKKSEVAIGWEADVWSFGCILAVMTVFIEGGPSAVEAFEQARKHAGCTFHINGHVNPEVHDCFHSGNDKKFMHAVDMRMLVKNILEIMPAKRPTMGTITEKLFLITQKSIFQSLNSRFRQLLEHSVSFSPAQQHSNEQEVNEYGGADFAMEVERFQIWGKRTGFIGDSSGDTESRVSKAEIVPANLHADLSSVLMDMENEIRFLENWTTRSLKLTCSQFRSLNDKLWGYVTPGSREEMEKTLEGKMLAGNSPEKLETTGSFQGDEPATYGRKFIEKPNLERRHQVLLKECDDNLVKSMGVVYRGAVRTCLAGDSNPDEGSLRDDFETKVVNRLASCHA